MRPGTARYAAWQRRSEDHAAPGERLAECPVWVWATTAAIWLQWEEGKKRIRGGRGRGRRRRVRSGTGRMRTTSMVQEPELAWSRPGESYPLSARIKLLPVRLHNDAARRALKMRHLQAGFGDVGAFQGTTVVYGPWPAIWQPYWTGMNRQFSLLQHPAPRRCGMSFDVSKKNKKLRVLADTNYQSSAQDSPTCFDKIGNSDPHKGDGHPMLGPYLPLSTEVQAGDRGAI